MQTVNTNEFTKFFGDALRDITRDMANVELKEVPEAQMQVEKLFAVIVGVAGAHKGRTLIRISSDLVKKITEEMNCGPLADQTETVLYIGEFSNILCGKAISNINNIYKNFDLRLTPPAIFSGRNMRVITPALQSSIIGYTSAFGTVSMDVGFERGR